MTDLDIAAKALWDAMDVAKPDWDQLGDVTKNVWRERVQGQNTWPFKYAMGESGPEVIVTQTEPVYSVSIPLEQPAGRKLTLKERIDAKRAGQQG